MTMFQIVLLSVLFCVTLAQDAVTIPAHHGHRTTDPNAESNEREHFNFNYEGLSHQMTITTGRVCYIVQLSDSERVAVHSDIGLRTIELKMLGLLSTAIKTEVQKSDIDNHVIHACGQPHHITHYYTMSVS